MNFTQNNHLKYTIGGRLYGHRETVYEKFFVSAGGVDKDYYLRSNWVLEQYRTASLISKEYGKDFVVMFSGGTDSEIVLRAFKHIGVTPRVAFIRFIGDYNLQDLIFAQQIALELGFNLEILDFDVMDFYKSGLASEFASQIDCRQIAYLSVYHHIKKMQLPAVMGGELLLRRHVDKLGSKWYYCFRENEDASAMRFSLKYNIPLVNEWFSYTPEMIAYYLDHPDIKNLVSNRYNYKLASVSTKNSVLRQYMPEIIHKTKTHGYERLLGFNGESYHALQKTHVKRLEKSLDGIFIDDLNKMLFGEENVGN
jgi:hypothetical protein